MNKVSRVLVALVATAWAAACSPAPSATDAAPPAPAQAAAPITPSVPAVQTVPGMPPVPDPTNLYSEIRSEKIDPRIASDLPRVYVPNHRSGDVWVIDPATLKVVDRFRVGINPQHVVPSWDLRTLWVANNAERTAHGSLTPIDPQTGKPGKAIPVDDPYNIYSMPDGSSLVIVAEAFKRLDFRDPRTLALQRSLATPRCAGINHAEFSIDGRFAIFTCEFSGGVVKIDLVNLAVLDYLPLVKPGERTTAGKGPGPDGVSTVAVPAWRGMPQDIRVSPDGKTFFVADMMAGGLHVVDGETFRQTGFIQTGVGAHGLYPSRDGRRLYVSNRGSTKIHGARRGPGSVSVIDFATQAVVATWPIPGGGSPDMGNVSADGKQLWLSGRYDDVVYVIDTDTGATTSIPVGGEPHGLTVWPQPGRYSLGHTGNMR